LKELFEELRVCLQTVKRKVDIACGFDALDAACEGAARCSALALFALPWGLFRGTARAPEVDPFAAALVAQDLDQLKQLIGGRDTKQIRIQVEQLPLGLPCWSSMWVSLLEVAAAVGGQVLRYLLEFHGLKPDPDNDCTLEHAVAVGEAEVIRTLWDRADEVARVKWKHPVVAAIVFHRQEVLRWLLAEQPSWLPVARLVARERCAFDVLLRLAEAEEELPGDVKGVLRKHSRALTQLGIPLGSCHLVFDSKDKPLDFDRELHRVGHSLLLVEGENGRTFGALIAVRWPKVGTELLDTRCGSFLFTLEGGEATRYSAVKPAVLFHTREDVCVGELRLGLKRGKKDYSIEATRSFTGGRFPALFGKGPWESWEL
jgi:hypothetical protein